MSEEEIKKSDEEFELVQVPTNHELAVRVKSTGKVISVNDLMVEMANKLEGLEKYLGNK